MAHQIIGRKEEIKRINTYLQSGKAEFIAIYGRRRVGKTYLVRQLFDNNFAFDMTGIIDGSKAEQMEAFHVAMLSYGYKGKKAKTWIEAFYNLRVLLEAKINKGKRCVVFIDELPCMDTPKAGFVNALGHFWNNWANWQPEIMLLVCGSATSWMVRNVIDNHGGLHDRITHEIHLHPFTLKETEEYYHANGFAWNRLSVLQSYMAIGGIPYYMSLFEVHESPATGLDRLFFGEGAELRKEYRRLFASLFRNEKPYIEIIDALSQKRSGLTREELAKALGRTNNGNLGMMLTDLIYCDFIRCSYVRTKSLKKNSPIYQLVDFYTIFYKTFLGKKTTDPNFWSRNVSSSHVKVWYGLAFERVCMCHLVQIKDALGIRSVNTDFYAWRSSKASVGAQIDIIIERADNTINICEAKYSDGVYNLDKEEYLKLRNRITAFQEETNTRCSIIPTMITVFGISNGQYSQQIPATIELDDIFT